MLTNPALNLLKTWLSAVSIPFAAEGNDLVVADATGGLKTVKIVAADETPSPDELHINGPTLTGRKLQKSLEAFHALQLALGYEAKTPVDRGPLPTQKLANGSEFELVAFRHTELRRVPNPPAAKFEEYKSVIERSIWRFYGSNPRFCSLHMLQLEDLRTFAQLWMVNYCGLYELDRGADAAKENERLLYTHLQQRFMDFRAALAAKAKNVLAGGDLAFLGRGEHSPEGRAQFLGFAIGGDERIACLDKVPAPSADDEEDPQYVARHKKLNTKTPKTRRASATKLLEQELAALGHDRMVEVLADAAENLGICKDSRTEAERRLKAHKSECEQCKAGGEKSEVVVPEEDAEEKLPTFYVEKALGGE